MSKFIMAQRILDEDADVVTLKPVYLVTDVPDDVTLQEVKEVLEKSDTSDKPECNWREYSVVEESAWGNRKWTVDDVNAFAEAARKGVYAELAEGNSSKDGATYQWLEEGIYGEVRVSLRLPKGLPKKLKYGADKMSLNSHCLMVLAKELGETKLLTKFEADRPKPGCPKKIEVGS